MIISDPELGFRLGIRSQKPITLFNGPLECKLLRFAIEDNNFFTPKAKSQLERIEQVKSDLTGTDPNAEMFANRLKKNIKKLSKWLKREDIHCYRIYDADLPEYAIAIDVYQGRETWLNIQEYQAPKSISPEKAMARLSSAVNETATLFAIPKTQIFLKTRSKQKGIDQYEKLASEGSFETVNEQSVQFYVNFSDYLDTGLFLDHRPIRKKIQQQAKNKHFLNLFAYTGTASVHAAIGGASSTTTVDMSKTYLDWAQRNMALNSNQSNNRFIRADCLEWIKAEASKAEIAQPYDLIFLDPPTFSNSKRMEKNLSIQDDHVELIRHVSKLLSMDGILYFSTNFRRFKLDTEALADLQIKEITAQTIPEDFSRSPRIHYCWEIKCP